MEAAKEVRRARDSFVRRWLEPVDRLAEAIYGVLILMTFTMAARASTGGDPGSVVLFDSVEVQGTLLAALGCAVAWGLIDGVMYLLTSLFERAEQLRLARLVKSAPTPEAGAELIAGELDERLERLSEPEERRQLYAGIYRKVRGLELRPVRLQADDVYGGIAIFLVALISTLPVIVPLIFVRNDPFLALRISNLVAIGMLFALGWRWARYVGTRPLITGGALALLGVLMVLVAIPLGG
jgi:VIT1/CCC1 family predicted Fe2+/Mn2+ transporter